MNLFHRIYCRSDGWAKAVQDWIMPWTLKDISLGDDVLEIGPGPGRTTEKLREQAARLTAIEIDHKLAEALKARMTGSNVTVVEGDATAMPFPDNSFSGAVSLTMLHHVPSAELQDRLLAETFRVLKPGAVFAGSDSTPTFRWRIYHIMDTCVAVDPAAFGSRLEAAGFTEAHVEKSEWPSFRFSARKPA